MYMLPNDRFENGAVCIFTFLTLVPGAVTSYETIHQMNISYISVIKFDHCISIIFIYIIKYLKTGKVKIYLKPYLLWIIHVTSKFQTWRYLHYVTYSRETLISLNFFYQCARRCSFFQQGSSAHQFYFMLNNFDIW